MKTTRFTLSKSDTHIVVEVDSNENAEVVDVRTEDFYMATVLNLGEGPSSAFVPEGMQNIPASTMFEELEETIQFVAKQHAFKLAIEQLTE